MICGCFGRGWHYKRNSMQKQMSIYSIQVQCKFNHSSMQSNSNKCELQFKFNSIKFKLQIKFNSIKFSIQVQLKFKFNQVHFNAQSKFTSFKYFVQIDSNSIDFTITVSLLRLAGEQNIRGQFNFKQSQEIKSITLHQWFEFKVQCILNSGELFPTIIRDQQINK